MTVAVTIILPPNFGSHQVTRVRILAESGFLHSWLCSFVCQGSTQTMYLKKTYVAT